MPSQPIARELGDVVKDFEAWLAKELSSINSALSGKGLEPITPLARETWEKKE